MSVLPGLLGINLFLVLPLPLAVLVLAFVLHRTRDREPLDLATGLSAYLSLMLVASAIVLVIGVAHFLIGLFGTLDSGFTYGNQSFFGEGGSDDADNVHLATGIAWAAAGCVMGAVHLVARRRLRDSGQLDEGVEAACEAVFAVGLGLFGLLRAAVALAAALERAVVSSSPATPRQELAYALPLLALWAVYGRRTLRRLGLRLSPAAPADA